jgi:hypothetical protein
LDAAALDLLNIAAELRPLSEREANQIATVKRRMGWR